MASHLGSAVKRLHKELKEINDINDTEAPLPFSVHPHPESFLTWHFTLHGPTPGPYASGRYHGRLEFPADYPFSPPSLFFHTPNGRFEVGVKVCLSVTGFHPEAWQPAWSSRTMLTAIREHFLVEDRGAIGYLEYSAEGREELAQKSQSFKCSECGYNCDKESEASETTDDPLPSSPTIVRQQPIGSFMLIVGLPILLILLAYVFLYFTR